MADSSLDRKTVVLVAGMHRSGTSAITRVVNLLGAGVPRDLIPQGEENPRGFWESLEVVEAHERVLTQLGSAWDSTAPLPPGWQESADAKRAVEVLQAFLRPYLEQHDVFVVKDPRLGRLLPLWHAVLEPFDARALVVMPFRNPVEVALSLNRRNGTPLSEGWMLWMRYCLEAERHSRAAARLFVDYSSLLADWHGFAERLHLLEPRLGQHTPEVAAVVEEFIEPSLRRNRCTEDVLVGMPYPFDAVGALYAELQSAAKGADNAEFRAVVDGLTDQFDTTLALVHSARVRPNVDGAELQTPEERAPGSMSGADMQTSKLVNSVRHLDRALTDRDACIARLTADIARLNQECADGDARLSKLRAEAERLRADLKERDARIIDLVHGASSRDDDRESLQRDLSSRDQEIAALRQVVRTRDELLQDLHGSTSRRMTLPIREVRRWLSEPRAQLRKYVGALSRLTR